MRTFSSFLLTAGLLSCSTAREASILPGDADPAEAEAMVPRLSEEERVELEAELDQDLVDEAPQEAQASEEIDRSVQYKQRTEIDFEDLDVSGELVKPQGALLLDRKRANFNPLIKLRTDFDEEMEKSVDEVK